MKTFTKRMKSGMIGEFYIYSRLLKEEKNCFISLGNAKSIDLILVDDKKRAHFIDVKTSNTLMSNSHKHNIKKQLISKIARWQLNVKPYWEIYKNPEKSKTLADIYIFYCIKKPDDIYILTKNELIKVMEEKIENLLKERKQKELKKNNLCNWDICEFCFNETRDKNKWDKIP